MDFKRKGEEQLPKRDSVEQEGFWCHQGVLIHLKQEIY
jgi:hypothetical protein